MMKTLLEMFFFFITEFVTIGKMLTYHIVDTLF